MKFSRKTGTQDEAADRRHRRRSRRARLRARRTGQDAEIQAAARAPPKRGYLDGQMLIAMPTMGDERFARSVIYVCAHSSEGAMGIIVNQPAAHISFSDLLVQLDVIPAADLIQLPTRAGGVKVLKGGPVETERGFVLHSSRLLHRELDAADRRRHLPHRDARHPQGDRARRRSAERDPRARLCRLGAGPARERDPAERLAALHGRSRADLRPDIDGKYDQALKKIGIDLGMLSSEAGHA